MFLSNSVTPSRLLSSDAGVLSTFPCAEAQASLEGLVLNIFQVARASVSEEYRKLATAHPQVPVPCEDELLTIQQISMKLDVCRQTIHNWVRKHQLKAYKLGGRTYFKGTEVIACLQEKQHPDGTRKNARRRFAPSAISRGKEVAYA